MMNNTKRFLFFFARQNIVTNLIVVVQVFDWICLEPHGFSISTACVHVITEAEA